MKVLKLGKRFVNRLLSCQFRCTLAKQTGSELFAIYAAGNTQAVIGKNVLTVR